MTERPATEPVTGLVDSLYWRLIQRLKGPGRRDLERQLERELREPEAGT